MKYIKLVYNEGGGIDCWDHKGQTNSHHGSMTTPGVYYNEDDQTLWVEIELSKQVKPVKQLKTITMKDAVYKLLLTKTKYNRRSLFEEASLISRGSGWQYFKKMLKKDPRITEANGSITFKRTK